MKITNETDPIMFRQGPPPGQQDKPFAPALVALVDPGEPVDLFAWMHQAQSEPTSKGKTPLVIVHDRGSDFGHALVVMPMEDWNLWSPICRQWFAGSRPASPISPEDENPSHDDPLVVIGEQLAKLDLAEKEAWAAWERGKADGGPGDPAYLEAILGCVRERMRVRLQDPNWGSDFNAAGTKE